MLAIFDLTMTLTDLPGLFPVRLYHGWQSPPVDAGGARRVPSIRIHKFLICDKRYHVAEIFHSFGFIFVRDKDDRLGLYT